MDRREKLPPEWRAIVDKTSGDTYYYNRETKVTQWHSPCAKPSMLPAGWRAIVDKNSGQIYYHNKKLNKTQWEKPNVVDEALAEREHLHYMMQSMQETYASRSSRGSRSSRSSRGGSRGSGSRLGLPSSM